MVFSFERWLRRERFFMVDVNELEAWIAYAEEDSAPQNYYSKRKSRFSRLYVFMRNNAPKNISRRC
jgi:hypothetical protein